MRDPKRHQQLADWGFTAVRLGKDGDDDIILFFKMIFMCLHQEQCGPGLNQMWKEFSTRPMSRSYRFVHLESTALRNFVLDKSNIGNCGESWQPWNLYLPGHASGIKYQSQF